MARPRPVGRAPVKSKRGGVFRDVKDFAGGWGDFLTRNRARPPVIRDPRTGHILGRKGRTPVGQRVLQPRAARKGKLQ